MDSNMRLDVNETAFFNRELESIKTRSYDTKYPNLKATSIIPVSTEADAGADYITYRRYTNVGIAKILANYSDNAPRADVFGEEFTSKVYRIASSYGYDRQEIRASVKTGKSLDQRRANAAKRASDEKVNSIAFTGDADFGIVGLINHPAMSNFVVPNGALGTPQWGTKTPDEIVADITGIVNAVVQLTNGVELPNTLLLPIAQYNIIATTRMTDGDSKTILQFILETSPYIKRVDWLNELGGAGIGGSDRMIVGVFDPEHITLEIPLPFEQLPPEQRGFGFEILTETRCGGIIMYYPLAFARGDNI
jgi:hypothetical protein